MKKRVSRLEAMLIMKAAREFRTSGGLTPLAPKSAEPTQCIDPIVTIKVPPHTSTEYKLVWETRPTLFQRFV